MALDTRDRRASAVGIAGLVTPPAPDGSINQTDRQHIAFCYRGISAAVIVIPDLIYFAVSDMRPQYYSRSDMRPDYLVEDDMRPERFSTSDLR